MQRPNQPPPLPGYVPAIAAIPQPVALTPATDPTLAEPPGHRTRMALVPPGRFRGAAALLAAACFPAALLAASCLACLGAVPAWAVETTGVPGSPAATSTIDGKQLPPPAPKFGGVIKDDAIQSRPWWGPRVVPPKKAPNVLLIMTDDSGFGIPSTFGGVVPTPTLDQVAANGLRYNNINSTALCSPTRAAFITGRNHHSVGFDQKRLGVIPSDTQIEPWPTEVIKMKTTSRPSPSPASSMC